MKIDRALKGYHDKVCEHCAPRSARPPIARLSSKFLTLVDCDGIYCKMHLQAVLTELRLKAKQISEFLEPRS